MTTEIRAALEVKLAAARERRSRATLELHQLSLKADKGDRTAAHALGRLNAQIAADGRLILSLTAQIAEAQKRIAYAEAQAREAARKSQAEAADGLAKTRLFEVSTPDNRTVRHWGFSAAALQGALLEGYYVTGEVHGANETGAGGFSVAIGSTVERFLAAHAHA
jgi:hypothetical protein